MSNKVLIGKYSGDPYPIIGNIEFEGRNFFVLHDVNNTGKISLFTVAEHEVGPDKTYSWKGIGVGDEVTGYGSGGAVGVVLAEFKFREEDFLTVRWQSETFGDYFGSIKKNLVKLHD